MPILLIGANLSAQEFQFTLCEPSEPLNRFSDSEVMEKAIEKIVKNGAPGATIALFSDDGWWYTAKGFSRIEDTTPMQICNLQFLQSISKTYHAVAILKLFEEGQIDLDRPMTDYLPKNISKHVTDAYKITVKMLLNHTSGIPEYNFDPYYIAKLLQSPDDPYTGEDYLKFISKKPLTFEPGSHYSYRNTNYVLLALILDEVTGDHAQYIEDSIFKSLGLSHTFYRNDPNYLNYPNLVNSYWDRYSNGIVENVTGLQRNNVKHLIGDDGIVTTPIEAVKFLKGLVEGKLLSGKTLELMKTWVKRDNGESAYGLGLIHTEIGGMEAYGHSGGGIGAGCELYYIPQKNIYFFLSMNLGTVTYSPLHQDIEHVLAEIHAILAR